MWFFEIKVEVEVEIEIEIEVKVKVKAERNEKIWRLEWGEVQLEISSFPKG